MTKKSGLLDSTREALRGLLGDFPEGFNAGATAGVAGYPGDMAYLMDAIRLAVMGERSQLPPEDYPLTTDAIAKAAGHPIPSSLSGQLGAAVGGLLTPGPGDLARFGPLLSAIPFWHGSPHVFDKFQMDKIGTGEGAQSYGHGIYGAENKRVAQEYSDKLGEVATYVDGEKLTDPMGSPRVMAVEYLKNSPSPEYAKEYVAMMHKAGLWKNNPEKYHAVIAAIDELAGKSVDSRIEGNLYRGEYRWADPAKEAATPLTGDDLLDWDKPLSEQSETVRRALGVLAQSDAPAGRSARYALDMSVDPLVGGARDQRLNKYSTGEGAYTLMSDDLGRTGTSKALLDAGIPGIRYLDGMSRGDGTGTHNYVMFDEDGIKLLERNGKKIRGLLD